MTQLDFDELESAYYWVSGGIPYENFAYVSRATGKVYWKSEESMDELPDDYEDVSLYAGVPNKNDLDLGRVLVFEFVEEYFPQGIHEVSAIFSRRGAYSRFKDLLDDEGLLDRWFEFERDATKKALQEWATENGFEIEAA